MNFGPGKIFLSLGLLAAGACGAETTDAVEDQFFAKLTDLCGGAFEGRMVSDDSADDDLAGQSMVMHVRTCSAQEIRVPFHVGEDHSRTWVITRTAEGLRLKHDHRHEDGSEDDVTQYGGDSAPAASADRIEFPVDQYSIDLFTREGLTASTTNTWAIEITDSLYAYELIRENRNFRVEFDLTNPVSPPPAPWGAEE